MKYKLVIALVLIGLIVIFIVQNVSVVEIRFLFWKFAMSRSLMMFLVLAIGVVIGWSLHNHFKSRKY